MQDARNSSPYFHFCVPSSVFHPSNLMTLFKYASDYLSLTKHSNGFSSYFEQNPRSPSCLQAIAGLPLTLCPFFLPLSSLPTSLQAPWSSCYFNMPNVFLSQGLCPCCSPYLERSFLRNLSGFPLFIHSSKTHQHLTPHPNSQCPREETSLNISRHWRGSLSLEEVIHPWVNHQNQEETHVI